MALISPVSIRVSPLVASVPPALLAIPEQLAFALSIPGLASVPVLQEAAGRLIQQLGGQTFGSLTDPQREALVALVQSNLVENSPDLVAALETLVRQADAAKRGAEAREAPRAALDAEGRFRLLNEVLGRIQGMVEQGDLVNVAREGRRLIAAISLDPVAWENPEGDFLTKLAEWVRLFQGFVVACEEGRLRGRAASHVLKTLRGKYLPALPPRPLDEVEVSLEGIVEEVPPAEPVREVLDWVWPTTAVDLARQVIWNLERTAQGKQLRIRTRALQVGEFHSMGTALWRTFDEILGERGEGDPLVGKSALLVAEGSTLAFLYEFKFERGTVRTSSHLIPIK